MNTGIDFDLRSSLTGALLFGPELLVQSLARRLRTRRGALFYDPSYGSFLPEYLGEGFDDGGAEAAAIAQLDLEEDPRVLNATVTVLEVTLSSVALRAEIETNDRQKIDLILTAPFASTLYPAEIEVTPAGVG